MQWQRWGEEKIKLQGEKKMGRGEEMWPRGFEQEIKLFYIGNHRVTLRSRLN